MVGLLFYVLPIVYESSVVGYVVLCITFHPF